MSRLALILAIVVSVPSPSAQHRDSQREVTIPGTDLAVQRGWLLRVVDGCRFSVPLDWKEVLFADTFEGPGGSSLHVERLRFADWVAHVARVRAVVDPVTVIWDGRDNRLWVQWRHGEFIEEYVETRLEDGSCSEALRHTASGPLSQTQARQILERLAPVRTR